MFVRDKETREAAIDLAKQIGNSSASRLGKDFIGFYLLGSLAHGGFNRRYSDIDVALISENGVEGAFLEALEAEACAIAPDLGSRVSIFWTDRAFSVGRFPPLDRIDYIEHAIPLEECERVEVSKPTLEEIQIYMRGSPLERWAGRGVRFSTQLSLDPDERKTFLKTYLYPARFAFSWLTGQIGSNDTAVKYLNNNPIAGLDIGLINRALACRNAAADPDSLFDDRISLPAQYEACVKLMG